MLSSNECCPDARQREWFVRFLPLLRHGESPARNMSRNDAKLGAEVTIIGQVRSRVLEGDQMGSPRYAFLYFLLRFVF